MPPKGDIMRRLSKPVKIVYVLYHDPARPYGGPAGDGSFTERWRATPEGRRQAAAFAQGKSYYGQPAKVTETDVSADAIRRYGIG